MTNEERDLIAKFIARVGGQPQATGGGFLSTSVPATQPALPPIDREADAFIAEQFARYPEAKYRMTQTALVQEAALAEAQNRIQQVQWELEQARQEAEMARQQAQQQPQQSKGIFGGLFGGASQPQPQQQRPGGSPWGQQAGQGYGQQGYQQQPPQPQYAPNYQPGMFQRGGSGFLGSALTTAAGVAGGMVVGNALMGAFGGHGGGSSWGGSNNASSPGSLFDGSGTTPVSDPTSGFASDAGYSDPYGSGGAEKGGFDAPTSWDGGGGDFGGGGGFDSGGGGFDDNT